ncbi:1-deoxy-D-xylulose-5-phosphate reductoisomerase [Temperatibacter marinus]|uniref:1-deoxy-D-xylulose 5-phosphate reductoisomerase n=1 Tax=Temperatibacter marinus TaxID=1456591 RepID=A0AA52EH21_9PROT|nr:1-deoxy-D-xylulose-5-phosphate reductoisomerase [Temperatibacter marinus]WND02382.1 1-deoxy-D-xylulose-5-phosphate reductoisomerase [Temperatibacter marinus]
MPADPLKSITILGATGSIGDSTLNLIRQHPQKFKVHALTAHKNVRKLAALAEEFQPEKIVIADETLFQENQALFTRYKGECLSGKEAIKKVAAEGDLIVAAIVGAAGLEPVLEAVRAGKVIALANKEALVCAGDLIMDEVKAYGATLLPVDSEHNAIYQVFDFERSESVSKLTLTASGGPFLTRDLNSFSSITPEEAVAHPNWDMGSKISVDSATMMNKGLELIEAYHLFPIEVDQLDVIIHPQSVIHSTVEYRDGSVLAQLGSPDMKIPISYCLDYPNRIETGAKKLDLAEIVQMTFIKPCYDRFPCLKLAMDALKIGGAAPTVLNAANEVAVEAFLHKKIKFTDISKVVEKCLERSDMKAPQSIANLLEIDEKARITTSSLLTELRMD